MKELNNNLDDNYVTTESTDKEKIIYDENENNEVINVDVSNTNNIQEEQKHVENDPISMIKSDSNDVMRMGFDASNLTHYCCPVCGSQRKSVSALTRRKRFKRDEETVAFITLCVNCGNVNFYGLDIPDIIEYFHTKYKRKRGK